MTCTGVQLFLFIRIREIYINDIPGCLTSLTRVLIKNISLFYHAANWLNGLAAPVFVWLKDVRLDRA
jgi:hypothetical protein